MILLYIFLLIVSLVIFYLIIAAGVKKGINDSLLAKFLEQEYNIKEELPKSYLDDDLDTDNEKQNQ